MTAGADDGKGALMVSAQNETSEPGPDAAADDPGRQTRHARTWVNWVLALLTVPGAAVVIYYALGAALSVAECADVECSHLGPSFTVYRILLYVAPVVAAATIIATAFTATRRRSFIVPLCGWALLIADIVAITIAFRH